jgi:hypothetical protein
LGSVLELAVRLVISMAAVMAVMALAARVVRRRQGVGPLLPAHRGLATSREGRPGSTRARKARPDLPVEVLYRRPLAKGAAVSLVQATGRMFLLGVTEQSVTLLAELPGPGASSATAAPEQGTVDGSVNLTDVDEWQQNGRMPFCERGPAGGETSEKAWKLALDSLRERTVRR